MIARETPASRVAPVYTYPRRGASERASGSELDDREAAGGGSDIIDLCPVARYVSNGRSAAPAPPAPLREPNDPPKVHRYQRPARSWKNLFVLNSPPGCLSSGETARSGLPAPPFGKVEFKAGARLLKIAKERDISSQLINAPQISPRTGSRPPPARSASLRLEDFVNFYRVIH